jgi:hypothetical protein
MPHWRSRQRRPTPKTPSPAPDTPDVSNASATEPIV